jgi:YidC/Oxa1 family membrane protein insertase
MPPPVSKPDSGFLAAQFGAFAPAAKGEEQLSTLENADFKITFTNKGGRIKEVLLKKYTKISEDAKHVETKSPLLMLEDAKNRFEYSIPSATSAKGAISTQDLYFTATTTSNTATFRAQGANGAWFEQKYVIGEGYNIDYSVSYDGMANIIKADDKKITFTWVNHLDKIEKNAAYEQKNTSLYFKEDNANPDYCACGQNDSKSLTERPIKWVSGANQFFNSSIIAKEPFKSGNVLHEMFDIKNEDLKKLTAQLTLAAEGNAATHQFQMYVGPNDFSKLRSYGVGLENIIVYGNSLFGTINRWVIRPVFDFLYGIVGNAGIAILLLTLLVKLVLFPLSYKMLKSQAKTNALKPEIEKLKAKHKDDAQAVQVETMKLYQEYGVNPLGGCMPTLLQMPIWMALFRFFPATLAFRQQSFLWATDLTGIEVFARIPNIPIWGDHISLFAVLWGLSLIGFTWYSMRDVDMSAQPAALKWMQYLMPLLFMVTFNSYAAGLSLYMMFSNVLNIGQTVFTKSVVINHDKIRQELEVNKTKPKKKSAFREKLDEAMKQQQEAQKQQKKK